MTDAIPTAQHAQHGRCRNWQRRGGCRYGDDCWYQHTGHGHGPPPQPPQPPPPQHGGRACWGQALAAPRQPPAAVATTVPEQRYTHPVQHEAPLPPPPPLQAYVPSLPQRAAPPLVQYPPPYPMQHPMRYLVAAPPPHPMPAILCPTVVQMSPPQPPASYYAPPAPPQPAPPAPDAYAIPQGGVWPPARPHTQRAYAQPAQQGHARMPQPHYNHSHHSSTHHSHNRHCVERPRGIPAPRVPAAAVLSGLFGADGELTDDYEVLLALDANNVKVCVSDEQFATQVAAVPVTREIARELCSICHDAYGDDPDVPVARLPCGHMFHRGCVKTWLNMNTRCPVCNWDEWVGEKKVVDPDQGRETSVMVHYVVHAEGYDVDSDDERW